MKMYGGVEVKLHTFLKPQHWMEVSGQLHTPEKEPWYPMDRRLSEPQTWSGPSGKEKKPCPFWESNLSLPACSLAIILTIPDPYNNINLFKANRGLQRIYRIQSITKIINNMLTLYDLSISLKQWVVILGTYILPSLSKRTMFVS
jgi:hypothetical protein